MPLFVVSKSSKCSKKEILKQSKIGLAENFSGDTPVACFGY